MTKKLEKQLVGKYAVKMIKTEPEKQGDEAYLKIMESLLEGSYINFKADKTYELSIVGKKRNGTWRFSDNGKSILTDKDDFYFNIVNFAENNLELKSFNNKKSVLIFLEKISG